MTLPKPLWGREGIPLRDSPFLDAFGISFFSFQPMSGSQYVLVNEVSTEHPLDNFVFRTLVDY